MRRKKKKKRRRRGQVSRVKEGRGLRYPEWHRFSGNGTRERGEERKKREYGGGMDVKKKKKKKN